LITAYLHAQPTQADARIQIHTQNNERDTQCSLLLSPGLNKAQQVHLDLAALQPQLTEHNIRLHTQIEQDQLQEIHLLLEDANRIIEGLIVAADQMHYVIPTHMIKRLVNRNEVELMSVSANAGSPLVKVEQQLLPLSFFPKQQLSAPLAEEQATQNTACSAIQSILMVIEFADKQQALLVDELLGFQQVVVTPLQGQLQQCRSFSGCCVLGKDKVAMVFDAATALQ
jgi:chemotaxis protein histidine kinase CheA